MIFRLKHAAFHTIVMNCDCNFYQRGEKTITVDLFVSFVRVQYSFLAGKNIQYIILSINESAQPPAGIAKRQIWTMVRGAHKRKQHSPPSLSVSSETEIHNPCHYLRLITLNNI